MSTDVVCMSTRFGPGCGHPVGEHRGGQCCCCNGLHNDPRHGAVCPRCRPIIRAYLLRQYGGRPIPPEFREPGDLGWPVRTHPLTGKALP